MYNKIYFIGVGGSGMFPLACICNARGMQVSGYDALRSSNTETLFHMGIRVNYDHHENNIDNDTDLVVYSSAIKQNDEELAYARNKKIEAMTRSKFLGVITKDYNLIAIAGSHGKSTVSSMVTQILIDCKKDPTSIIGAYFNKLKGNSILGRSNIAVCEACEYMDSFLDLSPKVGVILNIDNDHLDYFENIAREKKSFFEFAKRCKILVVNKDDKNSLEVSKKLTDKKIIYFSLNDKANFHAKNIMFDQEANVSFDLMKNGEKITDIKLKVKGVHNVLDCLASICVSEIMGLDISEVKKSIEKFCGVNRRFQFIGKCNGISVFDDYAHHPTEVEATLKTAKSMNYKRVIVIFQPHTFSRTYILMNDFARSFSLADRVILTDILSVREENVYGVKPEDLSAKIPGSEFVGNLEEIPKYIRTIAHEGDMIITMGAGNIYKYSKLILDEFS